MSDTADRLLRTLRASQSSANKHAPPSVLSSYAKGAALLTQLSS